MKVTLLYVASVDGKITKWGNPPEDWTSQEDSEHFMTFLKKSKLIVMGSTTFVSAGVKPDTGTLRVVLTRTPEKYAEFVVPGQLEFTNVSPMALVERLEREGYKEMTLVSGTRVTTEFFRQSLIDELWLTVEPRLFGHGDSLIDDEKFDISLQLITVEQLNKQGTLLVKYKVKQ